MLKELEYLVSLQKIDTELLEINELKGDLPQIVDNLEKSISSIEKELEFNQAREKEIIHEIKDNESQIEDNKEHLKRYQDQLYLVTSNKEYDALTSEIDTVRQKIDAAEYKILELNEEIQSLKESIKSMELTLIDKRGDLTHRREQLEKMNKKTDAAHSKLMNQRDKIIKLIPLRYIREYDRIAKAKEGVAIVPIHQVFEKKTDKKGNVEFHPGQVSCGGCHKIVPPQKIVEIRSGTSLFRCEFCGRLLYWDDKISEIRSDKEEELI